MNLPDYVTITELPNNKDYHLAEEGLGFVVPGEYFLTSISPEAPIQYVALLRYVMGEQRANHYHKLKLEHLIVLDGRLECEFFIPNSENEKIIIEVDAGKMITIKPGCGHTFTSLSETACVLELSPQKLDLSDQISLS